MPTSSEPPSCIIPTGTNLHCEFPFPADRSAQPLTELLPLIALPLSHFGRIHLSDTCEAMRRAVMLAQHGYLLVFGKPGDAFPLGYAAKKLLTVELLTGNRPDVLRLVSIAPCLPVSISYGEALRVLVRKHAQLGVLCDLEGTATGLCTRESLLHVAEDRL